MDPKGLEIGLAAVRADTAWAPPPLISTAGQVERGGRVPGADVRMDHGASNLQSFREAAPFLRRAEHVLGEPVDRGLMAGGGGWHCVSRRIDHCASVARRR